MNKLLTIVIISYKSKKLILSHIQKFYNKFKIIVVENSSDEQFKKTLKKNYKNVNIYLKNNIGYGRAVNFAAKKIKTKYFISILRAYSDMIKINSSLLRTYYCRQR